MKTITPKQRRQSVVGGLLAAGLAFQMAACSSAPWNRESAKDVAQEGPTVLNARTDPGTIELNKSLRANQPARVLADVKDFNSKVKDVTLEFTEVPYKVPMKNLAGTTYVATLDAKQLKRLAVSGKTITYQAMVTAKDQSGKVASAKSPLEIKIKAPELTATG